MLNYEYPPLGGGAANATRHILEQFAGRGDIEVELATSSTGGFRREDPAPNVRIHFLDIGKRGGLHYQTNKDLIRYAWEAGRYARALHAEKPFDVCHAFFGIPCGYVARKLHLPYIVSLRGSDVPFYNPRFRLMDRFLFRRMSRGIWRDAAFVVANSEGLRQLALQTAPEQPIRLIRNGVNADVFLPGERDEHEELRVLCVARLIPRKGIVYLIEALGRLNAEAEGPPVRLTLVGGGAQQEALRKAARTAGVQQSVHFTGPVDQEELPRIYQEHDVFVLPSLNEGMSNTVLEAMACGRPLVLTDTGGTRELLTPGENGFVVPMRSAEGIREALAAYLRQPELRRQHGEVSRRRAEALGWKAVAEEYLQLYRAAAAGEAEP